MNQLAKKKTQLFYDVGWLHDNPCLFVFVDRRSYTVSDFRYLHVFLDFLVLFNMQLQCKIYSNDFKELGMWV